MDELAKRFAELADKYGPSVANAAIEAARTEAYSTLVGGMLTGIFAFGFAYIARFFALKVMKEGWDEVTWIWVIIPGICAAIAGGFAIWAFIDPWTWTAINHPELWIAKRAFKL